MKDIIEKINFKCHFSHKEELYDYFIHILDGYDLIDFLEKLSCLRIFIKTSFLICNDDDRNYLNQLFDKGFCFFFPFLLCFKINQGNKKIDYETIYDICKKITDFLLIEKLNDDEIDEDNVEKIDYIQNNLTDLFGNFKRVPVGYVLQYENDLIKNKYNVTTDQLLEELIDIFQNKIYIPINAKKGITINEFINKFDFYINFQNFVIKKDFTSYSLCNDLAVEFGELDSTQFKISNPLSVINISRKLFIKKNGFLYNICDDLICGRLNRSIESLFFTQQEKVAWQKNYKVGTEEIIKDLFEHYLCGGTYYENSYYKDKNGNLCENDGLFIYHNFVFCIEIKGTKFNPDPVRENTANVKFSYNDVVNRVKNQTSRIMEQIDFTNNFLILDSHGSKILGKIENIKQKKIIGLCIYFEDIGTFLADLSKEKEKIIHISFYDLLIAFNYIENPFLIIKYLLERSEPIKDKRFYFNDEMQFLSLFRTCIHLNSYINSQELPKDSDIGDIFFPNDEFGMEIELYFIGAISKPKIEINDLILRIITTLDYAKIDDNLFAGLFHLLCESIENWNKLENKYKEKNNNKVRLPLTFAFINNKNEGYAIMIISQGHNPYQKKQSLAYIKRYFEYRKNVDKVYLVSIGKKYSEYKFFNRADESVQTINDKELLSDVDFDIIQHDHFD